MSYKFIKTKDESNSYDLSEIEYTVLSNDVTLIELLEEMEQFIKACGYSIKGNLEIVEETNES